MPVCVVFDVPQLTDAKAKVAADVRLWVKTRREVQHVFSRLQPDDTNQIEHVGHDCRANTLHNSAS